MDAPGRSRGTTRRRLRRPRKGAEKTLVAESPRGLFPRIAASRERRRGMTTADDAVRSGGSSGRCDPMHPASIAAAWLADRCRELRHCARTLLVLPPCFHCYAQSPDACTKVAQGSSADLSSPGREQSCVAAGVGTWTAAALGSPASALTGQVQRPRQAVNVEPGLQRCSASRATQTALGAVCTSCKARSEYILKRRD